MPQAGAAGRWGSRGRGNPGEGGNPRCPGLGLTSPGDEEDDSQRVSGDGEDVKGERGPEGDEGATKEHGSRHDARGSQSRRALQCPVDSGCRVRGGAGLRSSAAVRAEEEEALGRRGLEML